MDCQTFNYIEFTTLNKVKSGGDSISGTLIFAHHLKDASFQYPMEILSKLKST